jgi:uncharacterized cupin superfamily protein
MPVPEAKLVEESGGLIPEGPGWFIMNAADAVSYKHPEAGQYIRFENLDKARFPHYGIGIHVLWPGQPNAMYHGESGQESFMVLEGECRLIVEGEERIMRKWDFFHCAPMTRHITVGAGDGPCAILMVGTRDPDHTINYIADPVAAKHGAAVAVDTESPAEAYADRPPVTPAPSPWPLAG